LATHHPLVEKLRHALQQGRPRAGETPETAGFRQAEAILAMCHEAQSVDP
jgi:5-methyltetrahydrofolate--homocysteine methyltransferase